GKERRYSSTPQLPHPCCETDKIFPSGSLNHATLSPAGAVQIPSSSCSKKPNLSNRTPFASSPATIFSMSLTCHPRIVNGAGVNCAFATRTMIPLASRTSANPHHSQNAATTRVHKKLSPSPCLWWERKQRC